MVLKQNGKFSTPGQPREDQIEKTLRDDRSEQVQQK